MALEPNSPIQTLLCSTTVKPVRLAEGQLEFSFMDEKLLKFCVELHRRVRSSLDRHCAPVRASASGVQLPSFGKGEHVVAARLDFHTRKKLCVRRRRRREIQKALSAYVYQVEDLRSDQLTCTRVSRLKL